MTDQATNNADQNWQKIRAAMESAKPFLERQGFISRKSGKQHSEYWAIRYREWVEAKIRLRSIYIGSDPDLVARSRKLLATWQSVAHPERSPNPAQQQSWVLLLADARSMSRGHRRLFLEKLRPLAGDPLQLMAAVHRWPDVLQAHKRSRRRGRPRKGRLAMFS